MAAIDQDQRGAQARGEPQRARFDFNLALVGLAIDRAHGVAPPPDLVVTCLCDLA
jgi:hypothetical protein